ncbi:hypothetical protein JCM12298_16960 [Desulfothermus naphthae]
MDSKGKEAEKGYHCLSRLGACVFGKRIKNLREDNMSSIQVHDKFIDHRLSVICVSDLLSVICLRVFTFR